MPYSGNEFVQEAILHIVKNYPKDTKIIDIGAGAGKFGKFLKEQGFNNVDGIEVWKPYIAEFGIENIYRNVFNVNALDFENYDKYDLVLSWKTFEHFTYEDLRKLITKITIKDVIFSVPYKLKQGVCHNNKFEIHHQDDLTEALTLERYPEFKLLFGSSTHGCFKFKK